MSKSKVPLLDRLKYFSKREHLSEGWSEVSPYSFWRKRKKSEDY